MSKMIALTDDGMILSSDSISSSDFVNMTLACQLNMFNHIIAQAGDDADEIKEELYDMYNSAASAFLRVFAPEISLRPDLTEEAILKAENEILEARAAEAIAEKPDLEIQMNTLVDNLKAEMIKDKVVPMPLNRAARRSKK